MKAHTKPWSALIVLAVTVLGVIALWPRPARAAGPWYVAPGGSDGNSCLSAGSPCATINGTIGKASPGDVINVGMGTYAGGALLDKSVTLLGGWDSTFTTQNGSSILDGFGVTINAGVTTLIERFTIQNGGPIYNIGGDVTLNNSLIQGNTGAGGSGGGIFNGGNLIVNNSVISGNTTFGSGGGIYNPNMDTTVILNNSAVLSNTGIYGGGIYASDGTVILNNTTVSGNTASSEGGGIKTAGGGIVILNNSTVSGNTASSVGGGVAGGGGPSTVTLRNTIVAGNSALGGSDCSGPITSAGYDLIGITPDGYCSFTPITGDLTNVDPKLGPLQNNGGPTPTHALLAGSPAINAGNPTGCTDNLGNLLSFDQRGAPRVGRCDIGAYEVSAFATKSVSGTFRPGGLVTYTITLGPNANLTNASLTDTLPSQVTYVPNSFSATNGTGVASGGVITWTGTVVSNTTTVITFSATVSNSALNEVITNTALISGWGITTTASVTFDTFYHLYLPLVARDYCSPFSDNFSNPASGWPLGDDGNIRYEYLNGEYRILVRNTNWWAGARPGVKCSDYTVAVDVRNATGADGTYGLIFGLSDDWQQFYTFEIAPNGYYYLWRYNSGNWTLLMSGYSPSINTGTGTNRLKIERVGTQIKAYANDQLLTTLSDSTYTGFRHVGLITTSYSQPNVDARFDNFVMCAPGCSGAASLSGAGVTSQGTVNPTVPSSAGATSRGANGSKAVELPAPTPQPGAAPAERNVWRGNEPN